MSANEHGRPIPRTSRTRLAFMLGVIYCAADIALNKAAFSSGWTIIWPLNGATIALLLMRPRGDWPAVLCGVAAGTAVGEYFDDNPIGLEICQRLISVTEVLISACILPAFSTLDEWLRKPSMFWRFSAALVLGPGVSGVMAAALFHWAQGQPYLAAFNNWATADALGIAATLPLALSLRSPEMGALFSPRALPRTAALLGLAFATAALVFSVSRYPLLFLLYPVLLLVDSSLGFSGTALAVIGTCLISVYCATHLQGPFCRWPPDSPIPRDVGLQMYLGFNMVALFPASLVSMERRRMSGELRESNERLTKLASTDGLTGIANRRSLDQALADEWRRATRSQTPLALVMIDIDHFKQFNDLYGHHAGDDCLKAVAAARASQSRRPQDLTARFGGEEFALLLPSTDLAGAQNRGERVRMVILELGIDHGGSALGRLTVSVGCAAVAPFRGGDCLGLLQLADAALYLAKKNGRNRVETVSPEGLTDPAGDR